MIRSLRAQNDDGISSRREGLSGSAPSPEFASAIVLFNMAIAYLCRAKVSSTTTPGERSRSNTALKFHNGAIRLLQIWIADETVEKDRRWKADEKQAPLLLLLQSKVFPFPRKNACLRSNLANSLNTQR